MEPDAPCCRLRPAVAWTLWLLGAALTAFAMLHLDRPIARWCLAHSDDDLILIYRHTAWVAGCGGLHAFLILCVLLGTTLTAIRLRAWFQWLFPIAFCGALFAYIAYRPEEKDALYVLAAMPLLLFTVALTTAVLAGRPENRRVRAQAICKWLLLAFIVATLFTSVTKRVVRRPRPELMDAVRPSISEQLDKSEWRSFPSGDALVTTTVAVVLWGLTGCRASMAWILLIPLLAGLQRLAAARHNLGDVMAGFLFGAMWGQFFLKRAWARGWPPRPRGSIPRETAPGDKPG